MFLLHESSNFLKFVLVLQQLNDNLFKGFYTYLPKLPECQGNCNLIIFSFFVLIRKDVKTRERIKNCLSKQCCTIQSVNNGFWRGRTHATTQTSGLSLTELRLRVDSEVFSSRRACLITQLQLWLQWRRDILTWKVRLHILRRPTSHKPQAAASATQLAATSNTNKLE